MAKGFGFGGGLGDFTGILKQAQKMQREMARIQQELKEKVVEANSGGGMVKVAANGAQEILTIQIDPEVINPDDKEMLEDLILAAVTQAMKKAKEMADEELAKVTGGLKLPGLF